MSGLRRLEYRGYDSAGVAVLNDHELIAVRSPGKLAALAEKLAEQPLEGRVGIGHTRWATHGAPTEANAHPHVDLARKIAVVHNGIIENYRDLRGRLGAEGVVFRSETDTETIAHLVRLYYNGNLFAAVQRALRDVSGAYAVAVLCADEPDVIVAARQGSPLVLGVGESEMFVASDVPAIMQYTRRVAYLDNGQVCEVRREGFRVETLGGKTCTLPVETVNWDDAAAEKNGYPHFMLKEIHEQPDVIRKVLHGRLVAGTGLAALEELDPMAESLRRADKIAIVACGTAWHAALVGKRLLESFAKIPVEVDVASEYRYRDPLVTPNTVIIPVTQSGETADTLEALRVARAKGAQVLSIVNVVGSSVARESDAVLYTKAGPEIGVASTKAYTAQLTAFALLALYLGRLRSVSGDEETRNFGDQMRALPERVQWCLDHQEAVQRCARDARYRDPKSAFFMGRGYHYASALEAALKLKEISYIHAEGYAAGEMKHGPIALITDQVPMIGIATRGPVYEKMISNIQEIRARKGIILSVATVGDDEALRHSDDVIYVPDCAYPLSPIVVAAPLQLFAYYIAVNRGCDVDQPRNLAKSVTVE